MKLNKEKVMSILYRLVGEMKETDRFNATERTAEYKATVTRTYEDTCLRLYIISNAGMKIFYTFTRDGKLIHKMRS